jgi:hypothetical protein
MRQVLSIATVLALLASSGSPVMAACMGAGKTVSCHAAATQASHCDRAMHHHHEQQAEAPGSPGLFASESGSKCPMECCTPGHPQNGTVLASASLLPPLAVTKHKLQFAPVTFVSPGFSSHTDRGPPSA